MAENWMLHAKRADFKALSKKYDIDQVACRIMVNRGVKEEDFEEYLNPSRQMLFDGRMLLDAEKTVRLLLEEISLSHKIRVIGDYDIDGVTATYILVTALRNVGASVDYAIPHRIEDGYGLNVRMVEDAVAAGIDCIITCDNGIAARDAIAYGKERGVRMLITDHHQVPFEEIDGQINYILPDADAIVNPHQAACQYPYPDICGAVVAWKIAAILYEEAHASADAFSFLDVAAIATVGDVMPLQGENRVIVSLGLEAIRQTKNAGLSALIQATKLNRDSISAYHIGFVLGPCINASGRLETASLAVDLLLTEDSGEAIRKAEELVSLNEERKAMTMKGLEDAIRVVEEEGLEKDPVLVVYVPGLHESLAGIVAGRLKEKYYKPTYVLADGDGIVKGSGRSIPAYSMFERLQEVSDLLPKFGGHPMAAGLSISAESVDEFRRRLNENASLTEDDLKRKVMIDIKMPLSYISTDLVQDLARLEPFGNGNEKPVFAESNCKILRASFIGKEKQFLKLSLDIPGEKPMDALYFGDTEAFINTVMDKYSKKAWEDTLLGRGGMIEMAFTYYPQINSYMGRQSLQIVIDSYR